MTETSKKVLGYRRKQKEEWIKPGTWTTIDERKATKKKLNDTKFQRTREQLQALELDKEVNGQTKGDKRAFIEKLADEAETAKKTQNIAALYEITKTIAGGFKNSEVPNERCKRKCYHWCSRRDPETMHNKEAPINLADIPVSDDDLENNTDAIC